MNGPPTQNAMTTFEHFTARFVAQGFLQVFGFEYDQTFSPTAKLLSPTATKMF